jgi:hypothetical protein
MHVHHITVRGVHPGQHGGETAEGLPLLEIGQRRMKPQRRGPASGQVEATGSQVGVNGVAGLDRPRSGPGPPDCFGLPFVGLGKGWME